MQPSQQIYPTRAKARAFVDGFFRRLSPLLGVAIDGLIKFDRPDLGELDSARRARYLARVRKSASFETVCGILKAGCTPGLQEELAGILRQKYITELKNAIGGISEVILNNPGEYRVSNLTELPAAIMAQFEESKDSDLPVPLVDNSRTITKQVYKMKHEAASVLESGIGSETTTSRLEWVASTPLEFYAAAVEETHRQTEQTRQSLSA